MSDGPRIVALGGGTGLPVVLRGLADRLGPALDLEPDRLTGIVTVTDDGGSSGRLRRGRGVLPPGDVRNCLVAMSRDPHSLAEVLQYRYRPGNGTGDGLEGHSLGNLILAALTEKTGCFLEAIQGVGRVLAVRGRLLPSTLEDVSLDAEMEDGAVVRGESSIAADGRRIARVLLSPRTPRPAPGVLEALERANVVVLAPGSLFTSLLPNLLVEGMGEALRRSSAVRVLVGNLMTEPGETDGMDDEDHLLALERHLGPGAIDFVLVPELCPGREAIERYALEGQHPVRWRADRVASHGAVLVRGPFLDAGPKIRHRPEALADGLLGLLRPARRRLESPLGATHG